MKSYSKDILVRSRAKGFTLIELLVVVSIIGMLSSVVLAALGGTRAKARDAVRATEVRQLDTAVQLYAAAVGNVPLLKSNNNNLNCDATQTTLNSGNVSSCVANSNARAGSPEAVAWSNLQDELSAYIPEISKISDPCGANCITDSGTVLGYTYVAPAAMQYVCDPANHVIPANSNCPPVSELDKYNQSYQVYAPNENKTGAVGTTPIGIYYAPKSATPILCPSGQSWNGSSCVSSSVNTPTPPPGVVLGPPPTAPAPTISSASVTPKGVAQGGNLNISWSFQNAPADSAVVLELSDSNQLTLGRISQDLPAQGAYSWTVPGSGCGINVNGLRYCTAWGDSPNVNATSPGSYFVVVKLYSPKGGLGGGMIRPSPSLTYYREVARLPVSITGPIVTISSVSPSSGPVGTTVTITGSASSGTFISAVSKIFFGQSQYGQITPTLVSDSQVSFVVPGAISGLNDVGPGVRNHSGFYIYIGSGSYTIKVGTSDGNVSNGLPFTVTQPCNAPPGQMCP